MYCNVIASVRPFVYLFVLAGLCTIFPSDFHEALWDHGLLLWKEPITFWWLILLKMAQ